MSVAANIKLSFNAQEILRRVDRVPEFILAAMARGIDYQNELTIGWIQSRKLSQRGAMTLGVRTNRLRSSIRRDQAQHGNGVARGSIGSNVEYLGVHEFGFRGAVRVRAHTRQTGTGTASVKAHDRQVNFRERRMVRSSIEKRAGAYARELSGRVVKAWKSAHGGGTA